MLHLLDGANDALPRPFRGSMRFGLMPATAAFSPASLFANNEQGVWYDPSDLTTLFQDHLGTIPAAFGQPVGLMLDKSGRGNHANQPTVTARPTLMQDAGGRAYLQFDGVDDTMTIPAAALPSGSGARSQAFLWAPLANDASPVDYGTQAIGRRWFTPSRAGRQEIVTFTNSVGSGLLAPLDQSQVAFVGLPQGGLLGAAIIRVNGVAAASLTGSTTTTVDTAPGEGLLGGPTPRRASRIYGGVLINRLLAAEIASVEAYYGVTP